MRSPAPLAPHLPVLGSASYNCPTVFQEGCAVLLAIDIGNTECKLGAFQDERMLATWRLSTDMHRTADEYAAVILHLFHHRGVDPQAITGIALCSSVPTLNRLFEELCRSYFGTAPLVVGAGVKTGMRILYDNPREVGADRITDAVA
ncbi:MAG: type III pantothenate kinase, partial [Chloroflexi bacterium]|nr:type III pantothenate kinase [Chloroflexota bacterium]